MSNNVTKDIRYSDEDLQDFKVLIEGKIAKIKQELDYMREQIVDLNEASGEQQGGDFDDISVHTELEMLNNMVIRQQQLYTNLENALVRVQNKTYGICTVTGDLIEKKRLILVPHATKSVAAKEDAPKPVVIPTMISSLRENEEEDAPMPTKAKPAEPVKPKLITKVLRKTPAKSTVPKAKIADDDDFEWDDLDDNTLDDDSDDNEDDYDTPILGMNFDDMADESTE